MAVASTSDDLTRLYVNRDEDFDWSTAGKGALYGVLASTAAGGLLGFTTGCDDNDSGLSNWTYAVLGAATGAVAGVVGGFLVGTVVAETGANDWREVPLDRLRTQFSLDARGGPAFQLSFAFPVGEP